MSRHVWHDKDPSTQRPIFISHSSAMVAFEKNSLQQEGRRNTIKIPNPLIPPSRSHPCLPSQKNIYIFQPYHNFVIMTNRNILQSYSTINQLWVNFSVSNSITYNNHSLQACSINDTNAKNTDDLRTSHPTCESPPKFGSFDPLLVFRFLILVQFWELCYTLTPDSLGLCDNEGMTIMIKLLNVNSKYSC